MVFIVVVVVVGIGFLVANIWIALTIPRTRIPQAEDELAIAAYTGEVLAARFAQAFQCRVEHTQRRQDRIIVYNELARTAFYHVLGLDVTLQDIGACESTKLVEAAHLCVAFVEFQATEDTLESDDVLAVLQWQQEVVRNSDVNWFEFGGGEVDFVEWKLDVRELQLAETCLAHAGGKRVERGQFVAEHGCLELLLAIAELLYELFSLGQLLLCQLRLTCLKSLKIKLKCLIFCYM